MKSKPMVFLIAFTFMMFSQPLLGVNAAKSQSQLNKTGPMISIQIAEAYYTDLDNDGFNTDVYSLVILTLNGANRYSFEYYVTLTLPSGSTFTYVYQINTRLSIINLENNFYNHATELGMYNIKVQLLLKTGGVSYNSEDLDFDPPGGEPRPPSFQLNAW